MSTDISPNDMSSEDYPEDEEQKLGSDQVTSVHDVPQAIDNEKEVLAILDLDPALNSKMHIVNNVGRSRDLSFPVFTDFSETDS